MMAKMSDYLENALINATLRGIAFTPPAAVYLALFTSDPTDAGTGTEVNGGAYARQQVTFSAPVDGVTSNDAQINFPVATAAWGTVTHIGLYDADAAGNLLYHTSLSASKEIDSDDQFIVRVGALTVQLS